MEAVRWVTAIYAGVLVFALAASLIAILVQLWRIGTVLSEVRGVLGGVQITTAPLGNALHALHDAFAGGTDNAGAGSGGPGITGPGHA